MTPTHITQVFNNVSPLQAAGGAGSENSFSIPRTSLALRAETALTPQDGLTHHALGQIIGRLHPHISHKRPQILPHVEYAAAPARQRLSTISASSQQCFHPRYQRLHPMLKSFPSKRSIPHPLAQVQDLFSQGEQFTSNPPHCPFDLAKCLKIPFQMRPAQLPQTGKAIVSAPAVAVQDSGKGAKQLSGRCLSASGLNQEHGGSGAAHRPQPALLPITAGPAGLVGVGGRLLLHILEQFLIRLCQGLRYLFFARAQAAQTHWNSKHFVYQCQRLAFAGVERAGQNPHQSQKPRTKVSTFDCIRQRLIHQRSAIFAAINRLNIFGNLRLDGRNIYDLMSPRLFGSLLQPGRTAWTNLWGNFDTLSNQLRRQQCPHKRRMAFSGSAFLVPTHRRQDYCRARRVGRGRLGGILRIYSQPPFKFFDTFFQCRVFFFQLLYICPVSLWYSVCVFVHRTFIGQKQTYASIT